MRTAGGTIWIKLFLKYYDNIRNVKYHNKNTKD